MAKAKLEIQTRYETHKKSKIGITTAQEDIETAGKIVDTLAAILIDGDANPLSVLQFLSKEQFIKLFPAKEEIDYFLSHIEDVEEKFCTDKSKRAQVETCFTVAKWALEHAFSPVQFNVAHIAAGDKRDRS